MKINNPHKPFTFIFVTFTWGKLYYKGTLIDNYAVSRYYEKHFLGVTTEISIEYIKLFAKNEYIQYRRVIPIATDKDRTFIDAKFIEIKD